MNSIQYFKRLPFENGQQWNLEGTANTFKCFTCDHDWPCSIISTKLRRWGRMAQPIRMAICCTILMPVCRACQDFLLLHTALRKGRREGIPRAEATTAKARAVVFLTYSSMLSISGRIVEIIVAKPAACDRQEEDKCQISESSPDPQTFTDQVKIETSHRFLYWMF